MIGNLPEVDVFETGRKIKLMCLNRGISQRTFADILGVTVWTVHRWWEGEQLPNLEKMFWVAKILNTTVDRLVIMK